MLWVYGHYKYLILSVRGSFLYIIIYRRQILTYQDGPRAERVKGSFKSSWSVKASFYMIVIWKKTFGLLV